MIGKINVAFNLNRSLQTIRMNQIRSFSVAYNVKSKFEQAYNTKMETLRKIPESM